MGLKSTPIEDRPDTRFLMQRSKTAHCADVPLTHQELVNSKLSGDRSLIAQWEKN